MAYFDSTKNKALWEIRLGQLRKERAAREAGGGSPAFQEEARNRADSVRVPISYQELLKREAMESGRKRERTAGEKTREKTEEKTRGMTQVQEKQRERQVAP